MRGTGETFGGGTGMTEAYGWEGREVVDRVGEKVGTIEALYVAEEAQRPEWAAVKTGLFGARLSFVPITGAQPSGEQVRVQFATEQIKDAPRIEPDGELAPEEEAALYRHYGLEDWAAGAAPTVPEGGAAAPSAEPAPTGRGPVGRDVSGPTTDEAMTRSEEELRISTARRERGRARLRKYIVTEQVQRTVPVEREEIRIEREPITDENVDAAMAGPEISTEEHEVVLHEEVPVVEKRVVPKERVRMDKETRVEEEQVSEEVRKERIEAEGELDR
jgi:uncharacterized protein (TIGR02271 family)